MKDTYGRLTSLVVYNTNYFHPNSTNIAKIEFFLEKKVAFNEIIGIPTLKQQKDSIIFEGNFITSPLLQTQFTIIYKPSNTGIPSRYAFEYKELIQPIETTSSVQKLVMHISPDNPNINVNSRVKPPSIFTIQE